MGAPVARGSRGVLCTWTTQVWKSTRRADVMLKHEVEVEVEEERRPERNISDYMWCCYVGKCIERDVSRWRRRCRSVPGLSPHAHRHQDASVEESARRARARAHTREARGTHSRRAFGTLASTRAAAANECTFFNALPSLYCLLLCTSITPAFSPRRYARDRSLANGTEMQGGSLLCVVDDDPYVSL